MASGTDKKLKVLWFTNTPCSAVEKLGLPDHSGGWLRSLEVELIKENRIELGICFYTDTLIEPFTYKTTRYFPVSRSGRGSKLSRLMHKLMPSNNDPLEIKRIEQVVSAFNPDIIHVHGTEDNFGLLARRSKIPVIISIQGILNPYSEKYFDGIPELVCKKYERIYDKLTLNSFTFHYKQFRRKAERERSILENARYVMGRTQWDKDVTSVFSETHSYFINNEMLREPFYLNEWSKHGYGQSLQIVTTMSDNLYKGFETLVNTAKILKRQHAFSFTWHVIGLSNESATVKLVNKWKSTTPNDHSIQFHGQQNAEGIVALLLKADVYVQTSHIENSPNSLCEAMILGLPVISSYAGGTSSLLEHDKEGLLYQAGDQYALAGALLSLSKKFEYASKLGKQARSRALKRHNKQTIVEGLFGSYSTVKQENSRT